MAEPTRAAVFDVDGTICFDGLTIAAPTVAALRALRQRLRVVFASARPIRDLLPVLPESLHDAPLIGGNGAFVRDTNGSTVSGIDASTRQTLDALIDEYGLTYLIDGDWDYSFTGDPSHRIRRQLDVAGAAAAVDRATIAVYSKAVLFTTDPVVIDSVRALPLSVTVHYDEGIVDLSADGITKHHALHRIGVSDHTYVAFGNDANDVAVLQHAALSVRVGAHPALAFADRTVEPADVAEAISTVAVDAST